MGAWIMAGVTFREAARKRVLWMALGAGLAFLAMYGTGLHYQLKDFAGRAPLPLVREGVNIMMMMGLYAVNMLTVVMTVLTSVDTLSGEIASGTIQAVATKPIRRWEVVLGKWVGFAGMLTAYVMLMIGGVIAATYWLSSRYVAGVLPHHLVRGFALVWLESLLLLSLTFLCGASFSTLTNGVIVLGLHGIAFVGGWIEQAGAVTHTPRAVMVGIVASMVMPSEALWRRAVFEMQSPLLGSLNMGPFSSASVPSPAMIVYAAAYLVIAMGLAVRKFGMRDL